MPVPIPNVYEREKKPFIVTAVSRPERATAIKQAAGDFAGRISVSTFDPKDPAERQAYAKLVSEKEQGRMYFNSDRMSNEPRTPEQVDRQVIGPAERADLELIAIENQGPESLDTFWQRVDEIAPIRPQQGA